MSNGFHILTMTKRVKLTNLAIDGSFEDALNNWNCWLTEPTDGSQAKNGLCSLKLGGDALAASKSAISLVEGHKYYGREYIKTAGELAADDCRFELCGVVNGAEKSFVFGWNRGNYPDWTIISDVITIDGSYSDSFGIRTFTVGGTANAWVDSIVVVDLTDACGVGNEPSKEWCDVNIPFFSGSYTVDIPVSYPMQAIVQGLTIPEGVVTQIADENGIVLWRRRENAEPVIGTLILRPSADISVGHLLYPSDSTSAYLLINEEFSDGDATYITSETPTASNTETIATSKFKMSNSSELPPKKFATTSVEIRGEVYAIGGLGANADNEFILNINGTDIFVPRFRASKTFDISVPNAIPIINDFVAINGEFPEINLTITSHGYTEIGETKNSYRASGISQVYISATCEWYE